MLAYPHYFILIIYLLVKSSPFIYIMVIPLSHTRWLVPLPNINERAKTVAIVTVVIIRTTRSRKAIDIVVVAVVVVVAVQPPQPARLFIESHLTI